MFSYPSQLSLTNLALNFFSARLRFRPVSARNTAAFYLPTFYLPTFYLPTYYRIPGRSQIH